MAITSCVTRVWILLLASASPGAAAVLDVPVTPLVIRIYDGPAIAGGHSTPAMKEVQDILAAAGFATEWIPCAVPFATAARCGVPLGRAELAVRVVVSPKQLPEQRTVAMGYSLIDPVSRGGSLATIYLDRVKQFAESTHADVAALLGRAIAHEIGHLLLGTPDHGRRGVMRAVWSPEDVTRIDPDEWRFTAPESRRMRAAVTRRHAPVR